MSKEENLRNLSLKVISLLVWFEILWAVVFVISLVFQWTFITNQLSSAFFASGFAAALVLLAVTLLNFAANLHIISNSQLIKIKSDLPREEKKSFIKIIGVAAALIALIVFSLWLAEWKLYKTKAFETKSKLISISETKLVDEALTLIKNNGKIRDLVEIRDALSESIQVGGRFSLLVPVKRKNIDVYYELSAWTYYKPKDNDKISESNLSKFIPRKHEADKFNELKEGKINEFVLPDRKNLRAFMIIEKNNQKLILLIDTGRNINYSRSSFK